MTRAIKTAIFIDFDNVWIGLQKLHPRAAEQFAAQPREWLNWVERGMPGEELPGDREPRSILVRRCYLNPKVFHRYRADFTQAAFTVVDCPPLTQRGKTGADVHMVIDILDVLSQYPHVEEFVLFSADADFTPVLQRLRAHDKRTAVLTVGSASAAYTSASDRVLTEEFIKHALGLDASEPPPPPVREGADLLVLTRMGAEVQLEVQKGGPVPAEQMPRILRRFPEFTPESNWMGYYGLRALTRAIVATNPLLSMTDGDQWRVEMRVTAPTPENQEPLTDERMEAWLSEQVAAAPRPLPLAAVAQNACSHFGPQLMLSDWLGAGSFKKLLDRFDQAEFEVRTGPNSPGYLVDPRRHHADQFTELGGASSHLASLPPQELELLKRIHSHTNVPLLSSEEYQRLFASLSAELALRPYDLSATSKAIRDRLVAEDVPIPRQAITFVLKGIGYTGHRLTAGDTPSQLALAFRRNMLEMLDGDLDLGGSGRDLIDRWLSIKAPAPT
jgi:NYN domain